MNINIGTFIPKPHTPFQWAAQKRPEDAKEQLSSLKKAILARIRGAKVSYHEPAISYLEGLVSRGDERFAAVIESAYHKGCRLDAWDEHLDSEKWRKAIAEAPYDADRSIFQEYDIETSLPWDSVSMRVGEKYLKEELEKAKNRLLTPACTPECNHLCGVCSQKHQVIEAPQKEETATRKATTQTSAIPVQSRQIIITWKRSGASLYLSHISTMRNFEMAFQRSGLPIAFTQGYNPKPKLEFVNPLSMGIIGEEEVLLCELEEGDHSTTEEVAERLQAALAQGYEILSVLFLDLPKKETLAKYLVASRYEIDARGDEESRSVLFEHAKLSHGDFTVTALDEGRFSVTVRGERNMIKLLFGGDVDKFDLAQRLSIRRTHLFAEKEGQSYREFFIKRMNG